MYRVFLPLGGAARVMFCILYLACLCATLPHATCKFGRVWEADFRFQEEGLGFQTAPPLRPRACGKWALDPELLARR